MRLKGEITHTDNLLNSWTRQLLWPKTITTEFTGICWGPGGDPVLLCPQSSGRWSRRRAARAERRDRTRRSPAEMTSTSMTTRSALGQVSTERETELRVRERDRWRVRGRRGWECVVGIKREEETEGEGVRETDGEEEQRLRSDKIK